MNPADLKETNRIEAPSPSYMAGELPLHSRIAERFKKMGRAVAGPLIFAGAAGSWAFELSPANETFRADIAFDALERVNGSWLENGLVVGSVVAASTLVIEMIPSTLVAVGINREGSKVQQYINRRSERKNIEDAQRNTRKEQKKIAKAEKKGRKIELETPAPTYQQSEKNGISDTIKAKTVDFSLAMGIGAAAVVPRRHMQDPQPGFGKDFKNGFQASRYVAYGSGVVGFLAGGGIQGAADLGFEDQAQFLIDHGTDNKTWFGLFVLIQGASFAKKAYSKLAKYGKYQNSPNEVEQEPHTSMLSQSVAIEHTTD